MTDQQAYRRYAAEAERELGTITVMQGDAARTTIAAAGVWATLALAAAQDRVQPASRPAALPKRVRDGDGDEWVLTDAGDYDSPTTGQEGYPLETIARDFRGYTEIP